MTVDLVESTRLVIGTLSRSFSRVESERLRRDGRIVMGGCPVERNPEIAFL